MPPPARQTVKPRTPCLVLSWLAKLAGPDEETLGKTARERWGVRARAHPLGCADGEAA